METSTSITSALGGADSGPCASQGRAGHRDQARRGTSYGMPTELEVELAVADPKSASFLRKSRFVSSGTEATMSAVRLARAAAGRDLIIKFDGCYHGHSDSFLSEAGSGLATLGIAACPGVPQALAELTLNAAIQRCGGGGKAFRSASRQNCCGDRRAGRGQYGRRSSRNPAFFNPFAIFRRAMVRC